MRYTNSSAASSSKHHDRLGRQATVLGRPERHGVDAGLPRQISRRAPERHQSVGDSGAVEVHLQTAAAGECRQLLDLGERVDRAHVGRLGERQHRRLRVVRVTPGDRIECGSHAVGRHPEVVAGHALHDRPAAQHRRRPALAVEDVGRFVAQHRTPRRAQRRQRQGVGGGAAGDREHSGTVVLEHLAHPLFESGRDRVVAVGDGGAEIGLADRCQDLRGDPGGVVATKLDSAHPGVLPAPDQELGVVPGTTSN